MMTREQVAHEVAEARAALEKAESVVLTVTRRGTAAETQVSAVVGGRHVPLPLRGARAEASVDLGRSRRGSSYVVLEFHGGGDAVWPHAPPLSALLRRREPEGAGVACLSSADPVLSLPVYAETPGGARLRRIREGLGLPMAYAGERLGLTAMQVSCLEAGVFDLPEDGWARAWAGLGSPPPGGWGEGDGDLGRTIPGTGLAAIGEPGGAGYDGD